MRKSPPNLIDPNVLKSVELSSGSQGNFVDKIINKTYEFILENIFYISAFIVLVIFLIYKFYEHKKVKERIKQQNLESQLKETQMLVKKLVAEREAKDKSRPKQLTKVDDMRMVPYRSPHVERMRDTIRFDIKNKMGSPESFVINPRSW